MYVATAKKKKAASHSFHCLLSVGHNSYIHYIDKARTSASNDAAMDNLRLLLSIGASPALRLRATIAIARSVVVAISQRLSLSRPATRGHVSPIFRLRFCV